MFITRPILVLVLTSSMASLASGQEIREIKGPNGSSMTIFSLPGGASFVKTKTATDAGFFNSGLLEHDSFLCSKDGSCADNGSGSVASRSVSGSVADLAGSISFPLGMLARRPDNYQTTVSGGTVSNNSSASSAGGAGGQGGSVSGSTATSASGNGMATVMQNSGNTSDSFNSSNSNNDSSTRDNSFRDNSTFVDASVRDNSYRDNSTFVDSSIDNSTNTNNSTNTDNSSTIIN